MAADAPALSLQEKMAEAVGWSNAALTKAAAAQDAHEKRAAAVAAAIPEVVKALLDNERIQPGQEKLAAEALADPVKALEILKKVAAHRNAAETSIGTPVGATKTAAAAGAPQFNGGARNAGLRQSDINLFTKLGLAPPQS